MISAFKTNHWKQDNLCPCFNGNHTHISRYSVPVKVSQPDPCPVFSAPGAVGHLSFTEILDTSLKVSWREPNEKNGVLTGEILIYY